MGDSTLSEAQKKVFDLIESSRDEIIRFLSELVKIPSENPDYLGVDRAAVLGGETEVNRFLKPVMEGFGCETDMWEGDSQRENLVGVLKGNGGGRSIMFNGHVDTVPCLNKNDWENADPFSGTVKDGRIYGRGSCDMKGGIAAFVKAAEFIRKAGIAPKGDVVLATVVGEEVMEHEYGTTAVVKRGYRADAAIVAEPTSYRGDMTICPTSPGALACTLTCKGKPTHNSVRFELVRAGGGGDEIGVSALEKGVRILEAVQELERQWGFTKRHPLFPDGYFVIHPGVMHGMPSGIEIPYIVPDLCETKYVLWYPPQENPQDIRDEFEDYINSFIQTDPWLKANPPKIEWWLEWPAYDVATAEAVNQICKKSYEESTRKEVPFKAFHSVCDASFLNQQGIPAITFGPGDLLQAHSTNEFVLADELIDICKSYASFMLEWCNEDKY